MSKKWIGVALAATLLAQSWFMPNVTLAAGSNGAANGMTGKISPVYAAAPTLAAPSNLAATSTASSIKLTWTGTGAQSYSLTLNGTTVGSTPGTSYTFTGLNVGTVYTVGVRAVYSKGVSTESTKSVTTAPSTPSGANAEVTASTVGLTWQPSTGAEFYSLSLNGSPVGTTTGTSYNFTGLNAGTNYTLGITAENSFGKSSTLSVGVTTRLPAPSGLTTTNVNTNSITLNWAAVTGAQSYSVSLNGTVVGTTTDVNFTFTGLNADTLYTVGVAAVGANGTSEYATESTTTEPAITPLLLNSPIDLDLPPYGSKVFTFTAGPYDAWEHFRIFTSAYGGTGPRNTVYLELFDSPEMLYPVDSSYDGGEYVDIFSIVRFSMLFEQTYYLKVSGTNVHTRLTVEKLPSEPHTLPVAPTGLTTTSTAETVTLSWEPVPGATSYLVYRDGYEEYEKVLASTSYKFKVPRDEEAHTYSVVAVNGAGYSEMSTVTAYRRADLPFAPSSANYVAHSNSIDLYWSDSESEFFEDVSYSIWVNGTLVETTKADMTTITGLNPNQAYEISIATVNSAGSSDRLTILGVTEPSAP